MASPGSPLPAGASNFLRPNLFEIILRNGITVTHMHHGHCSSLSHTSRGSFWRAAHRLCLVAVLLVFSGSGQWCGGFASFSRGLGPCLALSVALRFYARVTLRRRVCTHAPPSRLTLSFVPPPCVFSAVPPPLYCRLHTTRTRPHNGACALRPAAAAVATPIVFLQPFKANHRGVCSVRACPT